MHHTLVTWSWLVANARASGSKVPFEWAIVSVQPLGLVPDACAMAFAGLWRQRGPCMQFPPWHKLRKTVMQCSTCWDVFTSNLSTSRPLLLIPCLQLRLSRVRAVCRFPYTTGCAHFAPESEKKQLNRRWQVQMGVLLVGTGALIVWSMLLGKANVQDFKEPCCTHSQLPYVALVNPGKYVSDRPGALEASKSRVKTWPKQQPVREPDHANSGTEWNQERICLGGALWVRLLNHIYCIFVVMRLCSHLLHTCCTPFSQFMWLTCFPGSQLAAGACACWLVSWVMSAPCWTFSVCCRRFWPLSSIADLAASVTACSLARVCLASSKMIGRYRQIIAFGAFDLNHEAWSWQMQINAEVHAAKTIQDPIPSESQKTNSKIQNTTSVAQ